jgi:hypothetical protein
MVCIAKLKEERWGMNDSMRGGHREDIKIKYIGRKLQNETWGEGWVKKSHQR